MVAPLTVYLLRHGEVHNPGDILYGRMPGFRLSTRGQEQVRAAARHLAQVSLSAIYTSPMQRAQETARILVQEHRNLSTATPDDRINECYTPYDGTSHADLERINFDLYTGTADHYEKPADLRRRLVDFLSAMRHKHPDQAIAAVSHGDIVVSAFLYAKNQPEDTIGRHRNDSDLGGLLRLGLPEGYPATASFSILRYRTHDADEIPEYHYLRPY